MKKLTFFSTLLIIILSAIIISAGESKADKGGCEAYLYISNNSLFEITLTVDGFPSGNLLVGKNKTFKIDLAGDTPKKIKVKVEYQDPDYIDPKSINYITKEKLECGKSDSIFVAFTK